MSGLPLERIQFVMMMGFANLCRALEAKVATRSSSREKGSEQFDLMLSVLTSETQLVFIVQQLGRRNTVGAAFPNNRFSSSGRYPRPRSSSFSARAGRSVALSSGSSALTSTWISLSEDIFL